MLELIILGQIPGTNYYITFTDVLVTALIIYIGQLVYVARARFSKQSSQNPDDISL